MLVTFSDARSNRIRHHAARRWGLYPLTPHTGTEFDSAVTVSQSLTTLQIHKMTSRGSAARIVRHGRPAMAPSLAGLSGRLLARHAKNQGTAAKDKNGTQKVG